MPEIQSPDPGRKLQKRYNLVGGSPAPFLSPELVPVVLIDDLTEQIPGVAFAVASSEQVPTAGVLSQSSLFNPSNSGVDISDVKLIAYPSATVQIELYEAGPVLSTDDAGLWQDEGRSGAPVGRVSHGTDVGAVARVIARQQAIFQNPAIFDLPNVVLPPGFKLHCLLVTINIGLLANWTWSERDR